MSRYPGWLKQDQTLTMAGEDDVSVQWMPNQAGTPFLASVGSATYDAASLEEAVDWCQDAARGRKTLFGPEPLEDNDPIESDRQFLEERGLTG